MLHLVQANGDSHARRARSSRQTLAGQSELPPCSSSEHSIGCSAVGREHLWKDPSPGPQPPGPAPRSQVHGRCQTKIQCSTTVFAIGEGIGKS